MWLPDLDGLKKNDIPQKLDKFRDIDLTADQRSDSIRYFIVCGIFAYCQKRAQTRADNRRFGAR